MSDYAQWRRLEKEFREFQTRHPNLYAAWSSLDDQWSGFGDSKGEEDRLRTLIGLAAGAAGHSGGTAAADYWLNLVKEYLLECRSKHIIIGRHDTLLGAGEIHTIQPLCGASADYCLERARKARIAERTAQVERPARESSKQAQAVDTRGRAKADGALAGSSGGSRSKPLRRRAKNSALDTELRRIADSLPNAHEQVFLALEGRVKVPDAEPFASAGGWIGGFKRNKPAARAWLSRAWSRLNLPSFPRGPKK